MRKYDTSDDGFTLLELVVAVAILMIILGIGMFAYSGIQDQAKEAAVESAAAQIFRAATAYNISGDDGAEAVREYNESQMYHDTKIVAHYEELMNDRIRITVYYDEDSDYVAIRETPIHEESDRWENDGGRLLPPEGPTNVNMTYQCNETKSGHLAIVNVSPETVVTMWEADNPDTLHTVPYVAPYDLRAPHFELRPETRQEIYRTRLAEHLGDPVAATNIVDDYLDEHGSKAESPAWSEEQAITNVSRQVTLEAGKEYTVTYDGQVETFAAPGHRPTENSPYSLADCLVSIDHFGDDTNLKQLVYLGGENLIGVPDNLPSTVQSLRGTFENSPHFNDPNIRQWKTENVFTMRGLFYNTPRFNQNISTWVHSDGTVYWDTNSLLDARMMFVRAYDFNNGATPGTSGPPLRWNMSNTIHVYSMFQGAEGFNADISGWNTQNVETFRSFLSGATSFNQDLSAWQLPNVTDHGARNWDQNTDSLEQQHKPVRFQ